MCRIFLVRYEASASFFCPAWQILWLCIGYSLLAGAGDVSANPRVALGWTYSCTPLHGSQIPLLYIGGVSYNLDFCALCFCHSSNTQLHGREILASLGTSPRVKILA